MPDLNHISLFKGAEDTNTAVWTPPESYFTAGVAGRLIMPELLTVRMAHYAYYPLKKIAKATCRYENEVFTMLNKFTTEHIMPPMAFTDGMASRVITVYSNSDVPKNMWMIGDLHGDLPALHAALEYIDNYPAEELPTIVFLGDAFDRFEYGYEVLLTIFHLMIERPGKILYLVGNHDVELYFKTRLNVFYPGVMPANFCEWLNTAGQNRPELITFGRQLIDFMRAMPHVLFLPDGTFMAHAGVPHCDVQKVMHTINDLNTINARQDFVWARFDRLAPHCEPDRGHKDSPLGFMDFDAFCENAAEVLEMPVKRMIHAHEHPLEQWNVHPRCRKHPLFTINSHRMLLQNQAQSVIAVARYCYDAAPEIHLLDLTVPFGV